MKLLRVIATMDPRTGGPSQGIRNSIGALQKLGIKNDVVCLDLPSEPFTKEQGFDIHALGTRKTPWKYNRRLAKWLVEHLGKYDVVIVHGLWLYHGFAVWKAIQRLKRKNNYAAPLYYVMPHGMLDPYFQIAPERRLKAFRNVIYWKLIESRIINDADGVLFTCETERDLAKIPFRPYRPKREICIGYGIVEPPMPDNKSEYIVPNVSRSEKFILYIGRIHQKKGLSNLIKAYSLLASQTPSIPKLVIAGPGMESVYGMELKKLALNNPNVVFPGMVLGKTKWYLIRSCEVTILPSHQENFGISVVESLACSKAVLITTKVNIWKEVIGDGAGLVAEDTIEGAYSLLQKWQDLKNVERKEMSLNAYKCFMNRFSIEKNAQNFSLLS